MITLLHGNYSESSRKEFIRLKEQAKDKDIRVLDGRTIDPASLTQATESNSMLGGDTAVFIENLFGKLGRKTKLIEQLSKIINESSVDIILWEDKEMNTAVLKSLPKAKIVLFKIPSVIFQFLDGITPHSVRRVLPPESPEILFFMIVKRIRQLIQLHDGITPEGLAGWQAARLTRQAKLFTLDTLMVMYKKLLDMEYSVKNGSSPFTLAELIEQFLYDNYS